MSPLIPPGPLVSVAWLANQATKWMHPQLVILDASLTPVGASPSPQPESPRLWIPGSRELDIENRFSDPSSDLPHTLLQPDAFQREARALGISRGSMIVVYDRVGVYSSPRAWAMFRAMGHDRVAVLDGGLPAWVAAGLPTETSPRAASAPGDFVASKNPDAFCDVHAVASALSSADTVVLDARPAERFKGLAPEPRPGLRLGHMPGAINLPFKDLLDRGGKMKSSADLAMIFAQKTGTKKELVMSCGSGVTACVVALAAEIVNREKAAGFRVRVYDGSWSEWGRQADDGSDERPVTATGD